MDLSVEHDHAFFAHEDPRYLVCACGQYAVRVRDMIGQSGVRLIDPPQPVLRIPSPGAACVVDARRDQPQPV